MVTLENILSPGNIKQAMLRVIENKGSPGVDGMEVSDLRMFLHKHWDGLKEDIVAGKYTPMPVRRVYIPKEGSKTEKRPLGIPTVYDRFVQQAVAQVLTEYYDPLFSPNSHAYRPGRGCQTAIYQLLEYANEGYEWVVDLDLRKFFDSVNHSKLVQVLSEHIKDGRVISLIHKMLRAPISENGKLSPCTMGTPQGGCVSPVLSNILLNEFDKEVTRRGHRFVRYADDCMILCKSLKAAARTLSSVKRFLENKLFLKLNDEKTKICRITSPRLKYLGFGFIRNSKSKRIELIAHKKSKARCIKRLREITRRNQGKSLDAYRVSLRSFLRGWIAYYHICNMKSFVRKTDSWLRHRIRQIYWKMWKKVSTKYNRLQEVGIEKEQAWMWANTRKGYWRIAASPILHKALGNKLLKEEGWTCLGDIYV